MNEAVDRGGPAGTPLDGFLVGNPECASCGHTHRRTIYGFNIEYTIDTGCDVDGCGCVASGDAYDRGVVDGKPLDGFFDNLDILHTDDYDDDYTGPRCLPGDAAPARTVDPGRDLRRGWVGWFIGSGLPRLIGDLGRQLVVKRGHD